MATSERPLRLEDIPVTNFGKYMIDRMKGFGDQTALVDGFTKTAYTFHDVIHRTERFAAGLQKLGTKPGDVVCILAPNHMDYLTTFYGTSLINATLQALNPLFTKYDLTKVFKECNTKIVVTIPELVSKVREASVGLHNIQAKRISEAEQKRAQRKARAQIITFGVADGCIPFDFMISTGSQYTTLEADWKSTTAVLLYSSGTTGFPKAVKTSHYSLIANALQMAHSEAFVRGELLVSFLPMFHLSGLICTGSVAHFLACQVVFMSRFDIEHFMRLIETYKPNTLFVVPPIMVLFAKHPKVSEYNLSSVGRIICGAAPLSPEIEEAVRNKLKLSNIQQGYGMTEVGVTHVNGRTNFKHNAVGTLLPLVEMMIVDVETGKPQSTNKEGEVWIRGPQVTNGYLNLPAQTREMFLEDGWVRTGDIGRLDEDGFLFIVDRLKELIKYKGFQVPPATLEDILLRHDAVADAGVVGVPDEAAGELPKAYIVKKQGKETTEKEIQNFVAGLVTPYMKLRGGVEFIDEIPRSQSGKILRRTLREKAKATNSKL